MLSEREILIVLTAYGKLTYNRFIQLLEKYGSLQEAVEQKSVSWLSYDVTDQWCAEKYNEMQKLCLQHSCSLITYLDSTWPEHLIPSRDMPLVLYVRGDVTLLSLYSQSITVVGSRNIHRETQILGKKLLTPPLLEKLCIVSGLAFGVDIFAHRLTYGITKTIAVIGSGLDVIYPQDHEEDAQQIITNGGLLISQFHFGTKAGRYTFPRRNILLAQLSPVTLVLQAQEGSGSMITAEEAFKAEKQILTIPHSPFNPLYSGNTQLIYKGCSSVLSPHSIASLYGISTAYLSAAQNKSIIDITQLSEKQKEVYSACTFEPTEIDEITKKVPYSLAEVAQICSILEIKKCIQGVGNNEWVRVG